MSRRAVISAEVPRALMMWMVWLLDAIRGMGIHIMGSRGSGKSRAMGRVIAWQDFVRGVPLIIIDPSGGIIDNLLDKVHRLPPDERRRSEERIRYVNMSGLGGHVFRFPLYFSYGDESLYRIAQRFLDVTRRADPQIAGAPILGWPMFHRVGSNVGMALAALGLQITQADDLVNNPEQWSRRLADAAADRPELEPVVTFFRDELPRLNASQLQTWRAKTTMFRLDPSMQAMFGESPAGIDWQRAVDEGWAVLLDFRDEQDTERLRFKLLWVYSCLMEFLKRRGPAGRLRPVSLMIDELSYLLSLKDIGQSLIEGDLDELINKTSRSCGVWLTLAHQELEQLPAAIQAYLMSMGTQIMGSTSSPNTARQLARRFIRFNPNWVRKYEPVYASHLGMSSVIDHRSIEFSLDEQFELTSAHFLDLPQYQFLVSVAPMEGALGTRLRRAKFARVDEHQFPDEGEIAPIREQLMRRDGVPIWNSLPRGVRQNDPVPVASGRRVQRRVELDH